MKRIIITTFLVSSSFAFSQISVGKETIDGDGLLDFAIGNRGISLPKTYSVTNPTNGTLIFDLNTNMVQYFDGNSWVNLNTNAGTYNVPSNYSEKNEVGEGIIIGDDSSTVEGVLVLESNEKALILPKVENPHLNIINPEPGMICYDLTSKSFAIFNGTEWSYWK